MNVLNVWRVYTKDDLTAEVQHHRVGCAYFHSDFNL